SPVQHPDLMPYLRDERGNNGFDIQIEAYVTLEKGGEQLVSSVNFKHASWTAPQLLAQQTINGSNVEIGDLNAAGAVVHQEKNLDRSPAGDSNEEGPAGQERVQRNFINDGETVILKAYGEKNGIRIGFGELIGKVLPSK